MRAVTGAKVLSGGLRRGARALRPPWARDPARFAALCDRCGACQKACPEHIITLDGEGYPEVDFHSGACSFCGDCAAACPTGALANEGQAPWRLVAHIDSRCSSFQGVICRACQAQCRTDAISFRPILGGYALPRVDPEACTGCGACVAACPLPAIELREKG